MTILPPYAIIPYQLNHCHERKTNLASINGIWEKKLDQIQSFAKIGQKWRKLLTVFPPGIIF